jgi:hypothetical protein
MKIYIGKYKSWFGPYQLAEALCFWVRKQPDEIGIPRHPHWVHQFGEWLAHGSIRPRPQVGEVTSWDRERPETWIYRLLSWIDGLRRRWIYVRIDPWDTWGMDHTLAMIILPMLRQLKATTHGAPYVDDADVPEHLRSTAADPQTQEEKDCGYTDSNHFLRWDWVLDEMIWAFEQKLDDDAENQFYSGHADHQWRQLDNGFSEMIQGPNHTFQVDREGLQAWQDRKQNGFRLFGRYYSALWD